MVLLECSNLSRNFYFLLETLVLVLHLTLECGFGFLNILFCLITNLLDILRGRWIRREVICSLLCLQFLFHLLLVSKLLHFLRILNQMLRESSHYFESFLSSYGMIIENFQYGQILY